MSDLRSLLEAVAGDEPPALRLDDVRRRAGRLTRRRRVTAAALVAAVVALAVVAVPRLTAAPAPPTTDTHVRHLTPGRLVSGRYSTAMIGQDVTFTVPRTPPWNAAVVTPTRVLLTNPDTRGEIEVARWTAVHRYGADGLPVEATDPAPNDLTSWLVDHPGIGVLSGPTATTLAGRPAHLLRIDVRPDYLPVYDPAHPATLGCGLPADCIMLAETPDHPVILYDGSPMVLIVQDTPGDQRLVAFAATPDEATAALPAVMTVLASFTGAP